MFLIFKVDSSISIFLRLEFENENLIVWSWETRLLKGDFEGIVEKNPWPFADVFLFSLIDASEFV